jgi:hypothetical protein
MRDALCAPIGKVAASDSIAAAPVRTNLGPSARSCAAETGARLSVSVRETKQVHGEQAAQQGAHAQSLRQRRALGRARARHGRCRGARRELHCAAG